MDERQADASRAPGLLHSLRSLSANTLALLYTRLDLLVTEIEEERAWFVRLLVLAFVAIFFLSIGVLTLTIFIILLAGDANRVLAAGLLTALYLGVGIVLAVTVRRLARARPRLFSASLSELRKDHSELTS